MKILLLSQKVFTEKQKLKLKKLLNDFAKDIRLITLNGLKTSKKFTLFSHYKNLNKLLSIN